MNDLSKLKLYNWNSLFSCRKKYKKTPLSDMEVGRLYEYEISEKTGYLVLLRNLNNGPVVLDITKNSYWLVQDDAGISYNLLPTNKFLTFNIEERNE